jgi:hypothetical protein
VGDDDGWGGVSLLGEFILTTSRIVFSPYREQDGDGDGNAGGGVGGELGGGEGKDEGGGGGGGGGGVKGVGFGGDPAHIHNVVSFPLASIDDISITDVPDHHGHSHGSMNIVHIKCKDATSVTFLLPPLGGGGGGNSMSGGSGGSPTKEQVREVCWSGNTFIL